MTAITSSITATAMDRTVALFIVSLILSVMYHADGREEKRYSQVEGGVERAVVVGSAAFGGGRARPREQNIDARSVERRWARAIVTFRLIFSYIMISL